MFGVFFCQNTLTLYDILKYIINFFQSNTPYLVQGATKMKIAMGAGFSMFFGEEKAYF